MKKWMLAALLSIGMAVAAYAAADHASPDEAKAMAEKAAAFLKANGPDKAFAAFKDPDGGFRDRDLYVVVQDHNGMMVFHPMSPALIGKSMLDLKDVDGKPFNRDVQAVKDTAWVEFKWLDPQTKTVLPKKSFVINTGDYFVMVGAYAQ